MKAQSYYRPEYHDHHGTDIGWGGSAEVREGNEVFSSNKACREWLEDNGYNPGDFNIVKIDPEDYFDEDDEIIVL